MSKKEIESEKLIRMWHKEGSQDSVGRRIRYKMKKISVYGKDITVKEKKGAGDAKKNLIPNDVLLS